ncbi:MAG: hypothetical protein JWN33_149 [Candidatus Saccharibacteria bacterium]|jgi:Tfp pilus assembly protein PilE|nr:hypothetical protein [Candidatus Saccharibacteria bacterium]
MTHRSHGFTVIELLLIIVVIAGAGILFFVQKNTVESIGRDQARKTAINAIYYNLEKVYFAENGSYPQQLTDETFRALDPALLTDPEGHKIGTAESDYRYEATNCNDNACKSYTLRTSLENEADFIRKND